jgi:hypothetical protein
MHHESEVLKADGIESCKKKNNFSSLFNSLGVVGSQLVMDVSL